MASPMHSTSNYHGTVPTRYIDTEMVNVVVLKVRLAVSVELASALLLCKSSSLGASAPANFNMSRS